MWKNKKNLFLFVILILGVIAFLFIQKTNPEYFTNVPLIGGLFNSGHNTSKTNGIGVSNFSQSFSVNANKDDKVHPLTGNKLNPTGAYNDGTYTGFTSTKSGVLILKITIANGAVNDISFLTIPKNYSSNVLSNLADEALQNQTVEISPIVGYDEISTAFTNAISNAVQKAFKVYNSNQ